MQDVKGKIRNDPAVINLFKAEPPCRTRTNLWDLSPIARCATPWKRRT